MIGIHLYILPGVDNGPETIPESLALARVIVREGIHTTLATPHYNGELTRYQDTLVPMQTRLVNQLTAWRVTYYPVALQLFTKLQQPSTLRF